MCMVPCDPQTSNPGCILLLSQEGSEAIMTLNMIKHLLKMNEQINNVFHAFVCPFIPSILNY